jgi:hypothetical protein
VLQENNITTKPMENKMTAIEWFVDNLKPIYLDIEQYKFIIQLALKMEKEQMIDAYDYGYTEGWHMEEHKSEEYYQENYGK